MSLKKANIAEMDEITTTGMMETGKCHFSNKAKMKIDQLIQMSLKGEMMLRKMYNRTLCWPSLCKTLQICQRANILVTISQFQKYL